MLNLLLSSLKLPKDLSTPPEGDATSTVGKGHDKQRQNKQDTKIVGEVQLKVKAFFRLCQAFVGKHANRQVELL